MHFQPIQFGGRIRKLRREHHLTQERLAVMLNISVEHLRKIELGKRGISIDLLLDLSNVLEASGYRRSACGFSQGCFTKI